MIRPHIFPGVFTDGPGLFTRNFTPGKKVYGERLVRQKGKEYRHWNPRRSKLAAYIQKKGEIFPFHPEATVLYLGAANGTTASHVGDIVRRGQVFCVEFSPRSFRDLVDVSRDRPQLIPILGDARWPERYLPVVGRVDVLYQDVSQRDQVEIFIRNADMLLQPRGVGMLMFKARSVDSSMPPNRLYQEAADQLVAGGYPVDFFVDLSPLQKDHAALVVHRSPNR
ncbi:MAG: fibrillarin-like rRNA/tRNA 2'-O-methyltransferase [Thermoplasmata archaeon]|nr:fibrillarin-like rRNA/tRNA 2'-O-methyltransferase [Thermoplasmata archaeon]